MEGTALLEAETPIEVTLILDFIDMNWQMMNRSQWQPNSFHNSMMTSGRTRKTVKSTSDLESS